MKRMNETMWLLVWLLLLFTGGCTQTDVEVEDISLHALKEVDAGFHLKVLANRTSVTRSMTFTSAGTMESDSLTTGDKGLFSTRSAEPLSGEQENLIAGIWVGQYDASSGALLYNKNFDSFTGNTVNIKLKKNGEGTESHVWFVANAGDLGEIATEAKLKEHVLTYASTESGWPKSNLCGMTGIWKGVVQEEGVKDLEVELTRLLAKISCTYSMGGTAFTFTPTAVSLNSVPQKIQIDAPKSQLTGMTYGTYTGIVDREGATMYWYLPENMAGTAVVDAEKKKIGTGVNNATYIELTGTAVQGGVTYEEVTFRFYPGNSMNNYNVERNSYYTMNVKLVGIDISDERITVGKIPPIVVTEGKMPAEKGGTKEVQITARPGQEWSFNIEEWLSAVINGQTAGTGTQVTYQGPALVTFQAVSANPKAEDRGVSFSVNVNGENQPVTITQYGSTLGVSNGITLDATSGSIASSSFKVTKGLQWLAALSGEDWWNWADDNPGDSGEATGDEQTLKVKTTTSNPLATERSGQITVSAGASVSDVNYTGLRKVITVKQTASAVKGSEVEVAPEAANGQTSSFTATPGLDWVVNVTKGDWLTLTGVESGNPTTGTAQNISFNVTVNPTAAQRSGSITVRAGDRTNGPTGTIKVKQAASIFTVSKTEIELENTATSGEVQVTGTKDLPWTVTRGMDSDAAITADKESGLADGNAQSLMFNALANTGSTRSATFTIAVTGGNHSKIVTVRQKAGLNTVTIDQAIANVYKSTQSNLTYYPPFNYDNGNVTGGGSDYKGVSSTATISVPYTIEVEKTQNAFTYVYNNSAAKNYCNTLGTDWRLPTMIELFAMWTKCKGTNADAADNEEASTALGAKFVDNWFWSSSVGSSNNGGRCVLNFKEGKFSNPVTSDAFYVRCVRDIP